MTPPPVFTSQSNETGGGVIGFVGLSHLGIVSSLAAAFKSKEGVIAYDPDAVLCGKLKAGEFPIFEPGLSELLKTTASRIEFTSDVSKLKKCVLIYFSPDTPTDPENRGDFSILRRLFETAVAHISADAILVLLSQVPPGFTRSLFESFRKTGTFNAQKIYYQVETLTFGNAVERALKPERFILGCLEPAQALPHEYELFLKSFDCKIFKMRYESAELAKMAINFCLASTLSAANSLAEICEKIQADWTEIVPALRTDKRIGPHAYLGAGLGIAGGNVERDLAALGSLAKEWGTDGGVSEAILKNSGHRKNWALQTLHEQVLSLYPKAVVALWGLAYKADTASTKNSPALALLESLTEFPVRVYDPRALLDKRKFPQASQAASALEACRGAGVLVVMTPWKEFSSVSLARLKEELAGQVVLDPFGVLDQKQCVSLGLRYFRLGVKFQEARR